jgi:hypothetical protein
MRDAFRHTGMRMAPMQWLLLQFKSVVKNPKFISSHNGIQTLISFLCVAHEKAQNPTLSFCDHLLTFWAPSVCTIFFTLIFLSQLHESWFDTSGMMWCNSYHPTTICINFFNFLKVVVRDQRKPTAPLFIVNISPPLREFTAPLCHIFSIHNITINSNNLFVNFRWTFTFCVEKPCEGTHPAFGSMLPFQHVSLKRSWFYHCQTSTAHR